jgi:hypothetical protein
MDKKNEKEQLLKLLWDPSISEVSFNELLRRFRILVSLDEKKKD